MVNILTQYFTGINLIALLILVSICGFLMLGIMATLLSVGQPANLGNLVHSNKEITKTLWINAIIYFILCILFSILFFYCLKHQTQDDKKQAEEDHAEILSLKETHPNQQ